MKEISIIIDGKEYTAVEKTEKTRKTNKYFNLSKLTDDEYIFTDKGYKAAGLQRSFMQIRTGGEYKYKGFYLAKKYHWEIIKDEEDALVLVLMKKD